MPTTIADLDALSTEDFVARLGGIFEHSPWVAERAAAGRPYAGVDELHAAMCAVVAAACPEEQLALIRAHPELAGRAAIRGELTEASTREQQGAGLDRCSPEEYAELTRLNAAYTTRFGFPFIIAVKGHTRTSIIAAMTQRIGNERDAEIAEALVQIGRIGRFRLDAMLGC